MFSCSNCGAQRLKWAGRCDECGKWGTLKEENEAEAPQGTRKTKPARVEPFAGLETGTPAARVTTGIACVDRVLAGGLVAGSVTLVGGEPGIGKSTLLAQIGLAFAERGAPILYVTGEESPSQVLLRLKRLRDVPLGKNLQYADDTRADVIAATLAEMKPALAIVDSVQTLRLPDVAGEPGNPTQIKASCMTISEAAKASGVPVILVGQVTKDGDLAGPRLLEHLVDTVLMLEGDRSQTFRILRALKHRFGAVDETAVFAMTESGLKEVLDPSQELTAHRPKNVPGSVITCLCEGTRPLLLEIQALVTPAGYATPSRRATGVDPNRLSLILAVLGRRAGIGFGDQDVFVNAVGGVSARDPSIDLAIALALVSAKQDKPLSADAAAWGELGLTGEIRPVSRSSQREKEARRLGFGKIIAPSKEPLALREIVQSL